MGASWESFGWLRALESEDEIRRRLDEELARAERYERPLSLAVFRATQPSALRLGRHIRSHVRRADIIGVLEPDRVVVIHPETSIESARSATARVRRILAAVLKVSVDAGVASYPESGRDASALLEIASTAA